MLTEPAVPYHLPLLLSYMLKCVGNNCRCWFTLIDTECWRRSLTKGLDPKQHPFFVSRDAACHTELLQSFVSIFSVEVSAPVSACDRSTAVHSAEGLPQRKVASPPCSEPGHLSQAAAVPMGQLETVNSCVKAATQEASSITRDQRCQSAGPIQAE